MITTPVSVVTDDEQPLQVFFFGLAPGLVGVWQMDVALPSVWSRPSLTIKIEYHAKAPNSFGESNELTLDSDQEWRVRCSAALAGLSSSGI